MENGNPPIKEIYKLGKSMHATKLDDKSNPLLLPPFNSVKIKLNTTYK